MVLAEARLQRAQEVHLLKLHARVAREMLLSLSHALAPAPSGPITTGTTEQASAPPPPSTCALAKRLANQVVAQLAVRVRRLLVAGSGESTCQRASFAEDEPPDDDDDEGAEQADDDLCEMLVELARDFVAPRTHAAFMGLTGVMSLLRLDAALDKQQRRGVEDGKVQVEKACERLRVLDELVWRSGEDDDEVASLEQALPTQGLHTRLATSLDVARVKRLARTLETRGWLDALVGLGRLAVRSLSDAAPRWPLARSVPQRRDDALELIEIDGEELLINTTRGEDGEHGSSPAVAPRDLAAVQASANKTELVGLLARATALLEEQRRRRGCGTPLSSPLGPVATGFDSPLAPASMSHLNKRPRRSDDPVEAQETDDDGDDDDEEEEDPLLLLPHALARSPLSKSHTAANAALSTTKALLSSVRRRRRHHLQPAPVSASLAAESPRLRRREAPTLRHAALLSSAQKIQQQQQQQRRSYSSGALVDSLSSSPLGSACSSSPLAPPPLGRPHRHAPPQRDRPQSVGQSSPLSGVAAQRKRWSVQSPDEPGEDDDDDALDMLVLEHTSEHTSSREPLHERRRACTQKIDVSPSSEDSLML